MEHLVESQKMQALQALADTNVKVSEAKAALIRLEEAETEYLLSREKKAMERVAKVLADSETLIAETKENYDEVMRFYHLMSSFADLIPAAYKDLASVIALSDERNRLIDSNTEIREAEILEMRKNVRVDRVKIDNDKKSVEEGKKKLEDTARKLDSDRGTLERSIARLKENKI